jgi:23S rRNA (pseudouridine1915-N3)-methyltransferase
MKLRIIWIGRTKDPNLATLVADFASRIGRFTPLEITELKDPKISDDARRIDDEGKRILAALDRSDHVIVLDAGGQMWTSKELAGFIGKHLRESPHHLTFVIGGPAGIAAAVKQRAGRTWSLSPLTFTHDMTRVLVLEQLYRALAILRGHPYAK